jgi:hypothetical protein
LPAVVCAAQSAETAVGVPASARRIETRRSRRGRSTARPDRGERVYVVERVLGHAWALWMPPRSDATEASPEIAAPPAGAVLPARLDVDACESRLEALVTRGALTLGRGRREALPELGPRRAAIYPFWLRYRRDRRGRVRFDALDAVTGSRPGSALRAALAAALIAADPVHR